MNPLIEECMLTSEQKSILLKGIAKGKERYQQITLQLPETITKKYQPFMQSDIINTQIEEEIKGNPHTQMKVYKRRAGFHPYIVIQDTVRNIFVLISKLQKNKYILNPSGYRGEFASSNFDRLFHMGVSQEELLDEEQVSYQSSLPLGIENHPFGIVVCYDGKSDIVYEGALQPNQEDWIYKEDISNSIDIHNGNFVPFHTQNQSDIEVSLKSTKQKDIPLKIKGNSTS